LGVGLLFEPAVQAAGGLGFATQEQLLAALPDLLQDDDTILVKGSRGMHLENTAAYIRSL